MTASSRHRIDQFEGLRGCLAWWVVLFHLGLVGGINQAELTRFEQMLYLGGWQAVELFIILSGFVIALLIETEHERYSVYLVRRFFRLAPVYYVLLVYGIVLALRQGMYGDRLREHVLLHLAILHGLVPDELLKGSTNAFVYPAWSISVEWQFYLVAPLVLALIRGSGTRALGLLVGCGAISAFLSKSYTFPFSATVVMRAGLFGVGIASYYLFRGVMTRCELATPIATYLLPTGLAVTWLFRSDPPSVGILWFLLFSTVLSYYAGVETSLTRPLRRFLALAPIVWLGKLSYCTYLCHMFVLTPVIEVLNTRLGPLGVRTRFATLIIFCAPAILAVSAALHYLVEKPGMRLGKRLAERVSRRTGSIPLSSSSRAGCA